MTQAESVFQHLRDLVDRRVDQSALLEVFGMRDMGTRRQAHSQWVTQALKNGSNVRDSRWTQALAVGGENFVVRFQSELGIGASHREIIPDSSGYRLGEPLKPYNGDFRSEMVALRAENEEYDHGTQ